MSRPTPLLSRLRRSRGLSLVETMISLVITATLLTAVGAAYTASAHAVEINDQFFRASQTARVCLTQLLAELRQGSSIDVYSTSLNVRTASGQYKTYRYDSTSQKLLLSITDGTTGVTTNYTAARNVSSCAFSGTGTNICISLVITVGNNNVKLGGSVVPRRTVTYK